MKLIPPDGTVQSLKKVFFLNYFVGKVGRGLEDSETLFALIYISKDDVGNRQYHDLKHFVYFFPELRLK